MKVRADDMVEALQAYLTLSLAVDEAEGNGDDDTWATAVLDANDAFRHFFRTTFDAVAVHHDLSRSTRESILDHCLKNEDARLDFISKFLMSLTTKKSGETDEQNLPRA